MIKYEKILICTIAILWMSATYAQTEWKILDNYTISFDGTGASGTFRGLEGSIRFAPEMLELSSFDVSIDPSTISTGNNTKNKHARGSSWLDVKQYPKIAFVSNTISKTETGFAAEGVLNMHGFSKKAKIDFTFSEQSGNTALFAGIMNVNREDFGIEGPLVSFMVGNEFEIKLAVSVTK